MISRARKNDYDSDLIPPVKSIAIEPIAIGDEVCDPWSDSELFSMPDDLSTVETSEDTPDSKS
jgi:hypothetical protein